MSTVWIIRLFKVPDVGWRALKPIWETRYRKPVLTTKAQFKETVIETPGGYFMLEWVESGKRKRLRVSDDEVMKAKSKQELRLQAQAAGIATVPVAASARGKHSLAVAIKNFLDEKQTTKAHKTWVAFKQVLETFQESCPLVHYLEDITRAHVMSNFVGKLQEMDLADRTIFHRFACLVSFFKATNIKVVTLKDAPRYVEKDIRAYTQADLDALFAACTPEERLLFEFFLYSGAREQEVMHAEWADLISDRAFLIREKEQWGFKPKGRKERMVPLPASLIEDLREAQKTSTNSLIFPHPTNGRPDGHLLRRLKAVVKRANLQATYGLWTLHVFRHTFGTMHLQSGVRLRTVQKWMGHKDIQTTQQYLDWIDAHSAEARLMVNKTFAVFAPTLALALAPAPAQE
jgi:integrase/recombinase XerD